MNYLFLVIPVALLFLVGIKIVRPTQRGLIERLGKYYSFSNPGFHWIIPVIDRMFRINVTEQMVDAEPQEIITNDNLNARVDAQVYFRVKADEESVKGSIYNVNNYTWQIVNLARTTLRNIIGTLTLKSANSERGTLPDRVRVSVDVHGVQRECDEDNNVLEEEVDAGSERPDIELQLGAATADCPDGLVTVTLRNVGTESASDVGLAFFAGNPSQGGQLLHAETFLGALAPGEEQTFDVTISDFPTTGDVTIYGVADPANAVDECNDVNNQDAADNAIGCRIELPH